ncbi:MAG TPA: hypothetical protein VMW63_08260 [Methanoregulaceae archaeon]|nr:hypothetical protein [Methanoregulaceae archaeon]
MTSRMHAPHTTCPGCREEVYLDELVKGRCPLCGCSLEEYEDGQEAEELFERFDLSWLVFNYFIFKKFIDMGASPIRIMQLVSAYEEHCVKSLGLHSDTRFKFELPHTIWDRIKPKRCSECGKLFFNGGKKMVSGDLSSPGFSVSYLCPGC